MASFQQRGAKVRAVVRLAGQKPEIRTFDSRAEAEAWAAERETELGGKTSQGGRRKAVEPTTVQSGTIPRPSAPGQSMTLRQALGRYVTEVTPTKKGAYQEAGRVRSWLKTDLADKALSEITTTDLVDWRQTEEKRPGVNGPTISPSTIRNKPAVLSAMYQHAASEWAMPQLVNPVRGVKLPKNRRGRDVKLTAAQREAVWSELKNPRRAPSLYYISKLAVLTAMRRGELCKEARWDRWDQGKVIRLGDTKNSDSRDVPLSTAALKVLREWWQLRGKPKHGPMFPDVDENAVSHGFRKVIIALRKEDPRFPHVTFHDLRHLAATDLSKKLSNVLELSAVTGHRSIQVLKRYYNPDASDLADKLG